MNNECDDGVEWIESEQVQELLKWLEGCTLAELLRVKEIIAQERERLNQ